MYDCYYVYMIQVYYVCNLIVYIGYNFYINLNDIVLMKLDKFVDINMQYVWVVCFFDVYDSFDQMMCIVIGWGVIYFGELVI